MKLKISYFLFLQAVLIINRKASQRKCSITQTVDYEPLHAVLSLRRTQNLRDLKTVISGTISLSAFFCIRMTSDDNVERT